MSLEAGKALKELASSMKLMIYPSTAYIIHIENSKKAVDELKTTLQASRVEEKWDIVETIPFIATTWILVDIIRCVETICEAMEELSKQAHFKKPHFIQPDGSNQEWVAINVNTTTVGWWKSHSMEDMY